ncbi:outer membrane protein assembly factor BamA [Pelagibacterales bacterium SAG-MED46]|nr:outer membrane protein assembly factor BamA [Pelagibacterales bacterium SAG-MED46]
MLKFYIIFTFIFCSIASAANIEKIIVKGNERVSSDTVKMFAKVSELEDINDNDLNLILRRLYESNFFDLIEIKFENSILEINVTEFPIVQNVEIKGIKKNKIKDNLNEIILFKSRTSYNKVFLDEDKNNIINFLKNEGYYFPSVSILVDNVGDNKVNINYDINLGKKSKIKKITFIGDKIFKESKLKSIILSEEYKFWKFISGKKYLNEGMISYDKRLLKNFYLNKGFYNVEINTSFAKLIDENEFELIYNISPGKKIFFNELNIKLPEDFNKENFSKLLKKSDSLKSKPYSLYHVNKMLDQIESITINEEFESIKATINEEIIDDKINITFNFKETEKIYIEKINIYGNNVTRESVIRNQIIVDEGDPFNEILFAKSINNIKGLNFFKTVESEVISGQDNFSKIINITIQEKPTGELFAGAGTGTNGASVSFGVKENNYLGKGISLDTNANITADTIRGKFQITNPNYKNSDKKVHLSIEAQEIDRLTGFGYKSTKTGISAGTQFEYYDDFNLGIATENFIEDIVVLSSASSSQRDQAGNFFDSFLSLDFNYDKRNQKFATSEGFFSNYSLDLPVVSKTNTLKNRYRYKFFTELYENNISTLSFMAGSVTSITGDDVKLSERLFIPSRSLRGFERGKVGPKDGSEFVGGNYVSTINMTSTIPKILENIETLDISIFLDAANVWGIDYDSSLSDNSSVRSSVGLGVNWSTPVGPLSFSFAQPLSKQDSDIVEKFRFNLGTSF